jgi:hypothetical protein
MEQIARCMNCGTNIEKDYILFINGSEFTFDSFECAVTFVAPRCSNCQTIIMGKGIHGRGQVFCSPACSHSENFSQVVP